MHLRSTLHAVGWRYAAREVLLIVIGVLLALTASDWQQRRSARQVELGLLSEINHALAEDAEQLDAALGRFNSILARGDVLMSYLGSRAPYADSLDAYFGTMYWFSSRTTALNTAAYESLKSQGLGLVSDQDLRSEITRVYEQTYPLLERVRDGEREAVLGLLRPYVLLHFRDLIFGQNATPLDYEAVSNDVEFLNLASYRLQLARQNQVPLLEAAIPELRSLIDRIDGELH
jgi:hypothetical protein